jgi:hypothetical protein
LEGVHREKWRLDAGWQLEKTITLWAAKWDEDPEPFVWHKQADEIIEKVRRGRAKLHQIKFATDQLAVR